jgi:hypothetical protein
LPKKHGALGSNSVLLKEKKEDLYNKNYRTLQKEIEEDTRTWKELPVNVLVELIL